MLLPSLFIRCQYFVDPILAYNPGRAQICCMHMKRVFCHIQLFNSSYATTGSIIYYSLGSIYDTLSKTYTDEIQKFLSKPFYVCLPKVAKLARSLTVKLCPKWCQSAFTAVLSVQNCRRRTLLALALRICASWVWLGLPLLIYNHSYDPPMYMYQYAKLFLSKFIVSFNILFKSKYK